MIKVLELFGGIGSCTQAFKKLGIPHEVVDYVEIDKYAVKSYNAMNGTNFEPQDITEWDKDIEVDFVMHGSSCQDFSIAGLNKGASEGGDTRSSLMYETARIVGKLKPKYVLWENVKNVLSKKHKHNFDNYLAKMEALGYTNYHKVLNAKDYNVPQNRERIFVLSMLDDTGFEFPPKIKRTKNLSDILEEVVAEKFYINNEKAEDLIGRLKNGKKELFPTEACQSTSALSSREHRDHGWKTQEIGTICSRDYKDPKIVTVPCTYYTNEISAPEPILFGGEQKNQVIKTDGVSTCLTSSMGTGGGYVSMVVDKPVLVGGIGEKNFGTQYRQGNRVYDGSSIAMCLTAQPVGNAGGNSYLYLVNEEEPILTPNRLEKQQNGVRIRKLTPKECWRLMGFSDEMFHLAEQVNSNTQLYKQAGNSIVVDVLVGIIGQIQMTESLMQK